ncbi:MAG: ATP-binding cassette domain-containing protein, partial [Oscillospiraceae bacterium]|nr:ATP-binding cassette domain-containing protein [Oscillospiraceae bacterium]
MDAIITLKKVCKSFGAHEIFRDYDLEIEQGDFVCITGESGKGKTTLLNIIGMLESPDSGTVTVNGVENPKLNKPAGRRLLKKDIFYVFQNYGLVEDQTVKYNLKIAGYFTRKTKDSDLEAALAKVGLGPEFLK